MRCLNNRKRGSTMDPSDRSPDMKQWRQSYLKSDPNSTNEQCPWDRDTRKKYQCLSPS